MRRSHEIQEEIIQKTAQMTAIDTMCEEQDREPTPEEQEVMDKFFGLN